ncbi:hypothetical protein JCM18899A_36050 [Nocardioides sp. AN3]
MSRVPATVAVLGSCITRDNFNSRFNPSYKDRFVCPLHQNQSSIIALMSPPVDDEWEPLDPAMNDYDQWNVRTELDRSFLDEVVLLDPDLLILDFFGDIHFGVVRLPDGRYVTDNRWKVRRTTWYRDREASGELERFTIYADTEAYVALWQRSFDALMRHLRSHLPQTTIVLHRGRNTGTLVMPDGERIGLRGNRRMHPLPVKRSNALWARLDDYAARQVDFVIDLRGLRAPTYDDHAWGPFYVHYLPEYYHRFLEDLARIERRRRWPVPLARLPRGRALKPL